MRVKYFSNRDLSHLLNVNLAKWKRWSREFLPPDPLGGYRSGYARQYSLNDAWLVFLGGHLVAGLKFTIPEARQILQNLTPWLKEAGILFEIGAAPVSGPTDEIADYQIYIYQESAASSAPTGFLYVIRGILTHGAQTEQAGPPYSERYHEWTLPPAIDGRSMLIKPSIRVVPISQLRRLFSHSLQNPSI